MVLRQNGIPAACAARQARISPSPNCMPHSPTGASTRGSDAGSPAMIVDSSRVPTSIPTRWRNLTASRPARLARNVDWVYEPWSAYWKNARGTRRSAMDRKSSMHVTLSIEELPSTPFPSQIGGGELKLAKQGARQVQAAGRRPQCPPVSGIDTWHRDTGAADLVAKLPELGDRLTGPQPGQLGLYLRQFGDGVRGERPHALLGEQAL